MNILSISVHERAFLMFEYSTFLRRAVATPHLLALQWAKEEDESEGSWARDILPTGLLNHRRHGEHSHSRLQEDCITQTNRASHTARHCTGSDADADKPTHPLPPWRWPVLRAGYRLIRIYRRCMQSNTNLAWTLYLLLHYCIHDLLIKVSDIYG